MNELSIARRYAKAIFELGVDEGRFDELGAELGSAARAFESDKDLLALLRDPGTGREAMLKVADALVSGLKLSPTAANALRLLAERSRLGLVPLVADAYAALADEKAGRVKARLISALPLGDETVARISSQLAQATRRSVVLERQIDPSILGGAVVQIAGKTYDGSLRTQIEGLKKQLKA